MQKYDLDKFYRIINNSQSNYANQLKRLQRNAKRANVIIIYYSVSLIIYSLSVKYFPELFNTDLTAYASVIFSIVVLIFSIINGNSRYPERISNVQRGLNIMKKLKRDLGEEGQKEFDKIKQEYENTVNSIEVRDDIDFYHTVIQLCKQYGISPLSGKKKESHYKPKEAQEEITRIEAEIRGYLTEIYPFRKFIMVHLIGLWHVILYLIPILVFILCMISNTKLKYILRLTGLL